ncbi:hypothetical protein MNBD_NITROSPIRAE02-449 [hydrothermal vent metagenome]|uniref:DUF8180 domain-containing protein n=1 Tax=hydrothermal vent metagenome TaxID=652676 RepID=A0A3B1CS41_9ZZZZ
MNDLEKLKKLLHHWMEHNDEHARVYREWSEKTSSLGKEEVSEILERLYLETKKLNGLFEEALKKL